MATPPDPTEDLKKQIAQLTADNGRLSAENTRLTQVNTALSAELDNARLGLRPNHFYPLGPSDDPFLTEGYTIQQPRTGKPMGPTALTVAYKVDGGVPQFTLSWKTPEAGAPALYRIDLREGEIEGPQHYRYVEVDGQLASYTWAFKNSAVRSTSYLFGMVAVGADGRRSAPLAVRAVVQ
ncbi:hypothetical protein [Streptomyces sp. UNOC14_S4]|uniref:hypothetical protein n=1 Tax=Streptomyces sp. UNOC14_S4 TaxID=2872340 RepID=UPI001E58A147|nr:hypothetical protein [Streptomyces sp. UNOC14_S4]MCC3766447.1 hypothetical protein [Streptomyces sp. UNOC14_S4]